MDGVCPLVRKDQKEYQENLLTDYTEECIRTTAEEENHWYGAKFESVLGKLIAAVYQE